MSLTVLAAAVIVQHVVACVSLVCSCEKSYTIPVRHGQNPLLGLTSTSFLLTFGAFLF